MVKYVISGTFRMSGDTQKFKKTIEAKTENHALHLVKALIGSRHKTRKHNIKISKVEKNGKK